MNTTETISQLKAAVIAVVVAVLVWIFAEGESLATRSIDMTVAIASDPAGDLIIRPVDPNFRGIARVRLEATVRMLDTVTAAVGEKITLTPGTPGVPNEPGDQRVIDLREVMSNLPELKGYGSTVADVQPKSIVVSVTRLVTRDLPVRLEMPAGVNVPLDGEPTLALKTATIRGPEPALAAIPEGSVLVARVTEEQLRRLKSDGPQTIAAQLQVPLGLRSASPVTLVPETVNVTLRFRSSVETLKLATVPVWFSMPPTEDNGRWGVQIQDKFLSDVTLSGPSEEIARVRAGQTLVKAMVELSSDDLSKGITSKQATFVGLPPSLSVSAPSTTVRVKISTRP
jgi:hypothetical protein